MKYMKEKSIYVAEEKVPFSTHFTQADTTFYVNIYCARRCGVTQQDYLSLPPYNRASLKGTGG